MLLSVDIADSFVEPGEAAFFVKKFLEGVAAGCLPCWERWGLPPLYESGIRFELPPNHGTGAELTLLPPVTYAMGVGDCDRLTVYRLAELYHAGVPAAAVVEWRGPAMHAMIRTRRGLEDPSELLGG